MIETLLIGLAKANLAAGAAVLLVAATRTPVRPRFGAQASYLLWLAPLAAGLAVLAPHPAARTAIAPMVQSAATVASGEFVAPARPAGSSRRTGRRRPALRALGRGRAGRGGAGAAPAGRVRGRPGPVGARAQTGGVFRAQSPDVGPAVVGVFRPRIVAPADFETRFAPAERDLILAHERTHLAGGDAGVNALACALSCLSWFNPLAHLAVRLLRIDQELACDATVIGRFPAERRTYAELLLKTQLATQPLPLGCHWPAGAEHPLKARIAMLKSPLPEAAMRAMGVAVVGALTLGAGGLRLGRPAQPPRARRRRQGRAAPRRPVNVQARRQARTAQLRDQGHALRRDRHRRRRGARVAGAGQAGGPDRLGHPALRDELQDRAAGAVQRLPLRRRGGAPRHEGRVRDGRRAGDLRDPAEGEPRTQRRRPAKGGLLHDPVQRPPEHARRPAGREPAGDPLPGLPARPAGSGQGAGACQDPGELRAGKLHAARRLRGAEDERPTPSRRALSFDLDQETHRRRHGPALSGRGLGQEPDRRCPHGLQGRRGRTAERLRDRSR